jgi:hypothetical protein
VSLDGLTTLPAETAAILARHQRGMLSLDGLKTLDTDVASALAAKPGWLVLDGVTKIEEVAEENQQLALESILERVGMPIPGRSSAPPPPEPGDAMEGLLPDDVSTLTSLTVELAKALKRSFSDDISAGDLSGLTELTPKVAEVISAREYIDLSGLTSLSPDVASALAAGRITGLSLDGLTSLSPDVASALAAGRITGLSLNGLTSLSPDVAGALDGFNKLRLNGLSEISPEAVSALRRKGKSQTICLNGLTRLTPEVASELVRYEGVIILNGVTTLPREVEAILKPHRRFVGMRGLEEVPVWWAEEVMSRAGFRSPFSLKKLSPEVARRLARGEPKGDERDDLEFPALESLTPESARALARCSETIRFGSLRELNPDVAAAFEQHSNTLILEAVTELSAETAEALARHRGDIQLPALDADAAATFWRIRGQLAPVATVPPGTYLGTLETLSPEAARDLVWDFKYELDLRGLKTLTPEAALALWQRRNILLTPGSLDWGSDRIESLSIDEAEDIGGHDFHRLSFNGLTSLDPEVAAALVWRDANRQLSFAGLTELSDETAAALSGVDFDRSSEISSRRKTLSLDGVRTLSPEAARALRQCDVLSLDGLTSLSPAVAAIFGQNVNDLSINGAKHLDPVTAAAIVARSASGDTWVLKSLSLKGLTSLSPEVARGLAGGGVEKLDFDGVTALSAEAARALERFFGNASFNGLTSLSPGVAAALGDTDLKQLSLDGLTDLDTETAKALAGDKERNLSLDGLASLSPEAAAALAGQSLSLDGLTSLSPQTARALAQGKYLSLNGLSELPADVAGALSEMQGDKLSLDGVKEISLEVAELLVKSRVTTVELRGLVNAAPEVLRTLDRCRRQRGRGSELDILLPRDVLSEMYRLPLERLRRIDDDVNR